MYAIDFFCGAGGLTYGLRNADINVVKGIDIDERCRTTFEHNNPQSEFLVADIRELNPHVLRDQVAHIPADQLLIAGCAPCQPFSRLNKSERGEESRLLGRLAHFIRVLQPGQVFIENVVGIAKVQGASTFRRFRKFLLEENYNIAEGIVDAKDYGVAQNRKRYIIIAMRGIQPTLPPPTHGPQKLPYVTVSDAIRNYPEITAGYDHPTIPNHRTPALREITLRRLMHTPIDGGDRRAWPQELWLNCHSNGHNGHFDVYGRMAWDRPAPTLTCRCYSVSNGRYGHPEQHRSISLREAAKIQSFPDEYIFHGNSIAHVAQQIGNAVPVLMAQAIGQHIQDLADQRALLDQTELH